MKTSELKTGDLIRVTYVITHSNIVVMFGTFLEAVTCLNDCHVEDKMYKCFVCQNGALEFFAAYDYELSWYDKNSKQWVYFEE